MTAQTSKNMEGIKAITFWLSATTQSSLLVQRYVQNALRVANLVTFSNVDMISCSTSSSF